MAGTPQHDRSPVDEQAPEATPPPTPPDQSEPTPSTPLAHHPAVPPTAPVAADPTVESLSDLLGGRRGAVDATLPPVAFTAGWLLAGHSLWAGVVAAVATGTALAGWRLHRGDRPRSVLIGLLAVCVAALIALRTGRAVDFFLIQLLSNMASTLAWTASIAVRWPLLGVVAGFALRQRTRWRRDPALLRAYSRGSWVWAATYLMRVAVFVPLYYGGQVVALTVARLTLSWPLVAAALAGSWWVIRRSLPAGHPGLRHPVPGRRTAAVTGDG